MSEAGSSLERATPGAVARREDLDEFRLVVDFSAIATWLRRRWVLLAGLLIIVAEVIWKGQFLSHMYFSQDDYVDLDIASKAPFDWHYLSLVGAGHLFPGFRAVTWALARISLYNWGLDAGVALALVAAASLAALRLLRTLFGDRPAILIPLAVYLLTPLTFPDLGWWSGAMESLPLQLSIFMTLNAHVHYVRTGRSRHLLTASLWLVIGMLFFEKAFVLPPLLFAITAGFLTGTKSWLAGAISTLRLHWKAWTVYGALMVGYLIMFLSAFQKSGEQPSAPTSAWTITFASTLLRDTLMTGAIGGPWQWFPSASGGLYALAAPPPALVWLSGLVVVAVLAASVLIRWTAWRAWAILFGWIICADVVPIVIGRASPGFQSLLGLETRYVAEAACVLAICLGLAFVPVTGVQQGVSLRRRLVATGGRHLRPAGDQGLRYAATGLVAVFVLGSVWSVQAYETSTPGAPAVRSYIANAEQAVKSAPRGINVLNEYMPQQIVTGQFGVPAALESTVIGDLARGKLAGKLHWIGNLPRGTIDGLWTFGNDGQLHQAVMSGVYTVARKGRGTFGFCWPKTRNGVTVVTFPQTTSLYDWTLRVAYLWGAAPSFVTVRYGKSVQQLAVLPGSHSAYLPVPGNVSSFTVSGPTASAMCVAGAQAGQLVPYGKAIR